MVKQILKVNYVNNLRTEGVTRFLRRPQGVA
jgi:hypothetical protein